jgi:hypothetical protein
MVIDTGILAGDIYNALVDRGIPVKQVFYYAGGGWHLKIASRGGLLIGVPIITYLVNSNEIEIRIKRLFGSTCFASFNLKEIDNEEQLISDICDIVIAKAK